MTGKRAGIYRRISLDRSGEGLAVERQGEDCRQLVALRGWTVVDEFTDNDISAAGKVKRPGFDRLLCAVRDGHIDVVVAWSLDRLTRNRRDQLRLIEVCQQKQVNLALVRGADVDLSSAVGRAVADILSATARMEIEQKSERQVRAIRQAAEKGRMVGGRRAFGYTADGLKRDRSEAALVRQMYDQFLSGVPLRAIAAWLNEKGVPTPRGNRWRTETVRVVLANPRNAGWRAMRPVDPGTGRREFYHSEPVSKGTWPAIVSDEVWRATVASLRDPSRRSSPGNAPRYLLSGIARCGWDGCGLPMFSSQSQGVRTLRCQTRRHVNRKAEPIEALVEAEVLGYFSGPARGAVEPPTGGPDLEDVRARALALRAELRTLLADRASGVLERDEYLAIRDGHRQQLAELDVVIAQAAEVDVTAPLRAAEDPGMVWASMSVARQREVLRRVMDVVVLPGRPGQPHGSRFDPATVQISWR